jgi:hypothetical protein
MKKHWVGELALAVVLGVTAAAIAAGGGPRVDQVEATITSTHAPFPPAPRAPGYP